MRILAILGVSCSLLMACSSDSSCPAPKASPADEHDSEGGAALQLMKAIAFDNGALVEGAVPDATAADVTLLPQTLLSTSPGDTSLVAFDVDNPEEGSDPASVAYVQLESTMQHIEVPLDGGNNKPATHEPLGKVGEPRRAIQLKYSVMKTACNSLCDTTYDLGVVEAVGRKSHTVSSHGHATLRLDCTKEGKRSFCKKTPKPAPAHAAPSGLTYTDAAADYYVGTAIDPNLAMLADAGAGTDLVYSVTPALPKGLVLDANTGAIFGTPSEASPSAKYSVTTGNDAGSTSVALMLTVNDAAPLGITYTELAGVYTKGVAITDNNATAFSTGGKLAFSIAPTLPAGLKLDATTGTISGTPTQTFVTSEYTVTATSSGGMANVKLEITVVDAPPMELAYSSNPASYKQHVSITDNTPSLGGGGKPDMFTIVPALPAGLDFDMATGVISGVPSVLTTPIDYIVAAINSGGSTSTIVTIDVGAKGVAPTTLVYASSSVAYLLNQAIASNTPSSSGGAPASYSVVPMLPEGLSLDLASGVISGTPTALSAKSTYTITASNAYGFTTSNMDLSVDSNTGVSGFSGSLTNGDGHTCAIVSGGAVCWGNNADGELGNNGGGVSSAAPVQVANLENAVQALASGATHSCALRNGGVWCWGTNDHGQLGNSSVSANIPVPVQVTNLNAGVQAIAAGDGYSCALKDTNVYCWGANSFGQLGDGSTTDRSTPVLVGFGTGNAHALTAGRNHACVLAGNVVKCWGKNDHGQLGDGTTTSPAGAITVPGLSTGLQAITASGSHTCVIVNGAVQCWGENDHGELGDNSTIDRFAATPVFGIGSGAQSLASGLGHTCAIVSGAAKCWGSNTSGQLGFGVTTDSKIPVLVNGFAHGVQQISAGVGHTCALKDGGVWCWGDNAALQLGVGSPVSSAVPITVPGLAHGRSELASGAGHVCTIRDGGVRCVGNNAEGELGNNLATATTSSAQQVSSLTSGAQAVASGSSHMCALANGGVWCWGANSAGELGNGTSSATPSAVPLPVVGLSSGVQAIAAGDRHTCALVDGGIKCWGFNPFGELGDASNTDRAVPVAVSGLGSGVQQIATGGNHTCALQDGALYCWGLNNHGQFGIGNMNSSLTPVLVNSLGSAETIMAAGAHTCVIQSGAVKCWGENNVGQVGDNSMADRLAPVQVSGLSLGVQAIIGGPNHNCALLSGGVYCWGANASGQLGDSTNNDSSVPVPVTGLTLGVQQISVGSAHSCAMKDGQVLCWGDNSSLQLGNGTQASNVPVLSSL